MSRNYNLSEGARLELYRVALVNAKSNANVVKILAQKGISEELLNDGSKLLDIANQAVVTADLRRKMRLEVYEIFSKKRAAIDDKFIDARKKAAVVFFNSNTAQTALEFNKRYEKSYVKWIRLVRNFYAGLAKNKKLAEKMAKAGISAEEIAAMQKSIAEIEALRARYISEKGNAQDATDAKKLAMYNLSAWMTRFFNLAKNTFKDQPQLLESFDIVVKN